jgi:hypothetical protein
VDVGHAATLAAAVDAAGQPPAGLALTTSPQAPAQAVHGPSRLAPINWADAMDQDLVVPTPHRRSSAVAASHLAPALESASLALQPAETEPEAEATPRARASSEAARSVAPRASATVARPTSSSAARAVATHGGLKLARGLQHQARKHQA